LDVGSGWGHNALPKLRQRALIMWGNLDIIDPPANDRTIAVGRSADAFRS
jgi:hypothetical protein